MQALNYETIQPFIDEHNIENLSYPEMIELFLKESDLAENKPEQKAGWNPLTQEPVFYNASRQHRPVDYNNNGVGNIEKDNESKCVICEGKTTRILDLANLSQGFTFINKNLYPAVWPSRKKVQNTSSRISGENTRLASGLHLLQWTTSIHDHEWHTIPPEDTCIVMSRLASLEKQLLTTSSGWMPSTISYGDPEGYSGYVSIIKNGGAQVGGSIAHSHQQIIFSNLMPRRIYENWKFFKVAGFPYSEHMQQTNPPELLVREYDTAVLLVPEYMRRPGDMLLLVKNSHKRYLHQLDEQELKDVSRGWSDALLAIHKYMPALNRPVAYNALTLNGPGAGLYFAFLPFTQETGGFEHLGLAVCQVDPFDTARKLRSFLNE